MAERWRGRFITKKEKGRRHIVSKVLKNTPDNQSNNESTVHNDEIEPAEEETAHEWQTGRRFVELHHLADELRSCKCCEKPLHLHNITKEQRYGYASLFYVRCECGSINKVTTGKRHRATNSNGMVYDVNTKAAIGMMHSGITNRQMTSMMATLEIRGLHHKSMKKREEEVHPHIYDVAKQSCDQALQAEAVSATPDCQNNRVPASDGVETGQDDDATTPCKQAAFKYDMGWQKRGSGRAYNSKSGVGTAISNSTGKICAYGIRIADCRMCKKYDFSGKTPPKHTCHKNWSGSAKPMEPE